MENKLEQLLNSLVEAGWKPRNKEEVKRLNYHTMYREVVSLEFENYNLSVSYSIRDLVSKSSGLWQFVCENGMVEKEGNSEWTIIYPNERTGDYQKCHSYCKGQSEYWLLESSLKDESEIEDFLLQNIKVEG